MLQRKETNLKLLRWLCFTQLRHTELGGTRVEKRHETAQHKNGSYFFRLYIIFYFLSGEASTLTICLSNEI